MKAPLWYIALCTRRYNKRQQEILRETAELVASRTSKPYVPDKAISGDVKRRV